MAVDVALVHDNLRKNGSLVPRIVRRSKIDFDQLLGFMGKTTGLSENDLRSVFLQFAEALVFFLPDGGEVRTPVGAYKLDAHYRRAGKDDSATLRDRKITTAAMRMQIRANRALMARIRLASSVNIVQAPALLTPTIASVENIDLAGRSGFGSPGQILHIRGSRLSFDKEDPEQGLFFIGDGPPTATARTILYSRIGTTIVDGRIPDLQAGRYRLEIRTKPHGNGLRIGAYDTIFTIA